MSEIVILGNGKDCDLVISLTDGRCFSMPTAGVTVCVDGTAKVEFECLDDRDVKVRYSGPGIEVRSARIGLGESDECETDDPDWDGEGRNFREDLRVWLSGDLDDDFGYRVHADIALASGTR